MRKKIIVFLALLACLFLQPAAAAATLEFKTFTVGPSGDYPLEDAILKNVEPNVLFYLDVSGNMTMSMKGQRPIESYTLYPDMANANTRIEMLKQDTFGMGGRPIRNASGTEGDGIYLRWGRDLDATNNVIGDIDCYYSLDPGKPYLLTFKNRTFAEWNGKGSPPTGFPQTLVPYLPARDAQGNITQLKGSVPKALAEQHLVPNDSKAYKLKVVLSRILSPSADDRNQEILSRMRMGVATTFYEKNITSGTSSSIAMKRAPYKYTSGNVDYFYQSNTKRYYLYHKGPAGPYGPYNLSGTYGWFDVPDDSGIAAQGSGVYNSAYVKEPYVTLTGGIYGSGAAYMRSILHVPFDFMYSKSGSSYLPTSSLATFRELIDGVDQVAWDTPLTSGILNDEFTISSIPGSAEDLIYDTPAAATRPVHHASGAEGNRTVNSNNVSYRGVVMRRMRNAEGLMTGTVVGTLRDFFHPKTSLSYNVGQTNGTGDTRGYFPVTGSCQGNWIIYFTCGNETKPGWSVNDTGSMMHSLQRIFLESKTMRGRNWNGSQWVEKTFEMDHPIRTIVVGLITTEGMENDGDPYTSDEPSDSTAKRLRKAMRRMAHAGQPKDNNGTPDITVEPIFADDVPSLVEKLQSVLAAIRTERLAGGAPRLMLEDEKEKNGDLALFASSYTLDSLRQWGSAFARYTLPKDQTNSVLKWDAGKQMENDTERQNKTYTAEAPMDVDGGTNTVLIDTLANFGSLTGAPPGDAQRFKNWLIKYANANGIQNENGILGNMEHSVYLTVGEPALSGIDKDRPWRIYIQTNRGVLHSLDYDTGLEQWAFIPPNILQNRLRHQKFQDNVWMGGDGVNSRSSQPLMLLDGLLSAHDITLGSTPATYMTGSLGWAGNGLYMMNVTNPANAKPQFVWAIDNDRYETPKSGSVHRWGNAFADYDKFYKGYEDLGLTIVAPELKGVKKKLPNGEFDEFRYVGVVPGGLGYNLNDSQGRAFYIFEPADGSIIKKITTANGYAGPAGSTLGMGITPAHYLYEDETTKLHAKEFFTGDSEGNVLYCDLTYAAEDWKLKSIFRLRAAGDKPIALPVGYLVLGSSAGTNQWLFCGTADITAPGQVPLTMPSGEIVNQQRGIRNDEQYIFGLHMKNPKAGVKTDLSYPTGSISAPVTLGDLTSFKYLKTTPAIIPAWSGEVSEDQPPVGPDGWKLRLRPKVNDQHQPTEAEYVTTEPFYQYGVLYVATFIPFTELPTDQERCKDIGYGKLYALDPDTGESMWQGGQAYVFKNIKIVGMSGARGNLFMGVKALRPGALDAFGQYEETKDFVTHAENSIVETKSAAKSKYATVPGIEPEIPHLQYWREAF
ncbi:MAG: hypothetical protein LBS00_07760 [Synergistaceae bacterium]|jgi:hypothetical protein|nr:hypothetical protein [Synergistaceae bacterium]